eukprot:scaffold518_cov33-Tisochrysis_lutea.AAC.1
MAPRERVECSRRYKRRTACTSNTARCKSALLVPRTMTSMCADSESKHRSCRAARPQITPAKPCSRKCAATSTPFRPSRTPLRDSLTSTTSLDVLTPRKLLPPEKKSEQKDRSVSPPLKRPTAVRTAWLCCWSATSRNMSPSSFESESDRCIKGGNPAALRNRTPNAARAGLCA